MERGSNLHTMGSPCIILHNVVVNVVLKVFQRRQDGTEKFERNWNDYANGFGNISGEYWLGKLHVARHYYAL